MSYVRNEVEVDEDTDVNTIKCCADPHLVHMEEYPFRCSGFGCYVRKDVMVPLPECPHGKLVHVSNQYYHFKVLISYTKTITSAHEYRFTIV